MNTYNFQIDTQCPQCGAPVVLEETECMIQCEFCRTRNIIHTHPFPCYYIEPGQGSADGHAVFYVPYWRFKGLEFSLGEKAPDFRIVDHSYLAIEKKGLPLSLGLRSQTQKLKFINNSISGSFLPPEISGKEVLRQITGTKDKKIHIGEILSLIFMPFYRNTDILCDGLTGKAVTQDPVDLKTDQASPEHHLDFTPGLCPHCGWDLKGDTDSFVLYCGNCMRFWLIRNKKIKEIHVRFYDLKQDSDLLLPFWRMQIDFKTLSCSSYAHLIAIADMPKAVTKEHENQPVFFFIPAFKVNPKLFLRMGRQMTLAQIERYKAALFYVIFICRQMTLAQIEPIRVAKKQDSDYYPVNLPLEEGFQAILPILMDLCAHKKETWDYLKKEKLTLKSFSLSYVSVRHFGSEYIQDTLGWSLPVNSLKFGRHL